MCSTRGSSGLLARRSAALALILACVTASAAAGQDADAYRIKVQRLAARLDAIRAEVLAEQFIQAPADTINVGRLHLVVRPERRDFLAAVAVVTWDSLATVFGADTTLISESYLHVQLRDDPRLRLPPDVGWYWIRHTDDPGEISADLTGVILRGIWERMGTDLLHWLRSPSRFDSLSGIQAEVVYVELVTAPWEAVKLCRAGDLEACARILGLVTADDTVSLWYTVEEQRRTVERRGGVRWVNVRTSPDYVGCLDGDDAACSTFLNQHLWMIGHPLSATARESMMRVALEVGGEGALGRLAVLAPLPIQKRVAS